MKIVRMFRLRYSGEHIFVKIRKTLIIPWGEEWSRYTRRVLKAILGVRFLYVIRICYSNSRGEVLWEVSATLQLGIWISILNAKYETDFVPIAAACLLQPHTARTMWALLITLSLFLARSITIRMIRQPLHAPFCTRGQLGARQNSKTRCSDANHLQISQPRLGLPVYVILNLYGCRNTAMGPSNKIPYRNAWPGWIGVDSDGLSRDLNLDRSRILIGPLAFKFGSCVIPKVR